MAIDGVSGPITPVTSSGGRAETSSVLLENEDGVIGTVAARNDARIEGGARASNISVSEPSGERTATGGQRNLSADSAVIAQAAGEPSTGPTIGASGGTSVERALGSAVDIVV